MKTVLIIDDEQDVADVVKTAVEESIAGSVCTIERDFRNAAERIKGLRPDAIVLDLMEGHKSANLPGENTWRSVWESTFCPIVIYTGSDAELQPPLPPEHPFAKRIQKGAGTQSQVVAALKGFTPAAYSVSTLRAEVEAVIHKVLRDTAGDGHLPMDDASHLLHAGRRRIAATMDSRTITGDRPMANWEQYLIPAMGESPLTADLLRKREAAWNDPGNYRIVLTPSCDLVKGRCEPTLIAACCESTATLVKKLSLSPKATKLDENAEKVKSKALTPGFFEGFLPLPGLPSRIPLMVANLKRLEVIDWDSVGPIESLTHDYVRVASIDSPFREQVAWAYMTTAVRPGMPDRELISWAKEIVEAAAVGDSREGAGHAR